MNVFTAVEEHAMRRALELAARGLDTTDPNPRVGCVILQSGEVVGEGWHERAGGPHAEVLALAAAGERAAGATVYVTLEPCNHYGRTPPCVEALVAARVGRVIYAAGDPNRRVSGGGAERLRAAGIEVASGLLAHEAVRLNAGFLRRAGGGRPWVRLKQATSLDGRTALADGTSRWITGAAAREDVHRWRARSSAVLTGIATVLADDPALSARPPGGTSRQPLRVVLDARLATPPVARLLGEPGETLIFAGPDLQAARRSALAARGARIEPIATGAGGRLDLPAVLAHLATLEVNELWIECGPKLAGAWLRAGLVDEWILYVAPCLLGGDARPLVELPRLAAMRERPEFAIVDVARFGPDLRLILEPERH